MKFIISILLVISVIIFVVPVLAQDDIPISPINFGDTQNSKLTDRTPVVGYQFAANQGDKIAITAAPSNEALTFLDVQLLDSSNGNVIDSQYTSSGTEPAHIMSEILSDGIYLIRLSKGDAVGGGDFWVNLELMPQDTEIIQSSAHGMGKPILVNNDFYWDLLRGDFNRCHDGYSPVPKNAGWGILWYRNPSDETSYARPEFYIPGVGWIDNDYSPKTLAMPGGIDFVMVPPQLIRAAADPGHFGNAVELRDIEEWLGEAEPKFSLYDYEFDPSPSIVNDMAVDIELVRHFSEEGKAPFFHHQIEINVSNIGEYNIPGDAGRIAFAVYNTAGELVDLGGYMFESSPFEVGTTRTITLWSASGSGSCVQPYDPQGHEIWVGIFYGGNPNVVFNAFEIFPVGTVPFEIPTQ